MLSMQVSGRSRELGHTVAGTADARDRLVRAAMDSFARRGFHATTTRDIAAGAGMSPAAVYVHHASKEELLFWISLAGHDEALAVVEAAAGRGGGPAQRLRAVVGEFTTWHAEHHALARVVQYELGALSPDHRRQIATRRNAIERVVRSAIEDGVASADFSCDDVPGTALAMLSLAIDVARWFHDDTPQVATDLGRLYGDLALRMVAPAH